MRVLQLLGEGISNGGEEAFIVNMIEHMDLDDMQVDVLTPYSCNNIHYKERLEKLGVKVFAFGYSYKVGGLRTNIIHPLQKFLKEHHYDVVHIHSGSISVLTFAAAVAKLCHVKKVIVHSHNTGKKTLKYRLIKTVSIPLLTICADCYCACSVAAGEWKFSKKIVHDKLIVVKNGIDLNKYIFNEEKRYNMRKQLEIDENTILIGHIGRFAPQKNHKFLINIFSEIRNKRSDSKLLLIGSGELEEQIKTQISENGIEKSIIFLGNVNNVYDYLQAMDIFIFPSLYEGLGIVLIEAQGVGVPCVVSNSIPAEAKLTDNFKFISLNEPVQVWGDLSIEMLNSARVSGTQKIREQGYDIVDTARMVKQLYCVDRKV